MSTSNRETPEIAELERAISARKALESVVEKGGNRAGGVIIPQVLPADWETGEKLLTGGTLTEADLKILKVEGGIKPKPIIDVEIIRQSE